MILQLLARLGLDISGFQTGTKKAESAAARLGGVLNKELKSKIAGLFSAGVIIEAGHRMVEYASKVEDLNDVLGLGTGKVQELDYALGQHGGHLEDLGTLSTKLAEARQAALDEPTGPKAIAFKSMGITEAMLQTSSLGELILKVGDAFKAAKNPQELLAQGMELMGKSAKPMLGAMREGLRELGQQARDAAMILNDETIHAFDELGDHADATNRKLRAAYGNDAAWSMKNIAPTLSKMLEIQIKAVPTFLGGLSVGGLSGGFDALSQMKEDMDKRDETIDALMKKRQADRDAITNAGMTYHSNRPEAPEEMHRYGPSTAGHLNALQQVGAFIGVQPLQDTLKRIDGGIGKVVQNTAATVTELKKPVSSVSDTSF